MNQTEDEKNQQSESVAQNLTAEEQDLYKFCFEEDGYVVDFHEDEENNEYYACENGEDDYGSGFIEDDLSFNHPRDDTDAIDLEESLSMGQGRRYDLSSGNFSSVSNSFMNLIMFYRFNQERNKKITRGKESSENLKKIALSNTPKQRSGNTSKFLPSTSFNVLNMLESSKRNQYWSMFDLSYQGVLGNDFFFVDSVFLSVCVEYGVVVKILGNNQHLISSGYQEFHGVTLKKFNVHNRKIEEVS
jgi:hypothetical protein